MKGKILRKTTSLALLFSLTLTTVVIPEYAVKAAELFEEETVVVNASSIEEVALEDNIDKEDESEFKSCRLIVFSDDDLTFENAKTVTKYDDKYFVDFRNVEDTKAVYNRLVASGVEVEIDLVNDTPEDVENKDKDDKTVADKVIADTNEEKPVKTMEKANEEKDIVVAVLDTGLNVGEDIFNDKVVEGRNFIDEDSVDTSDKDGHGTTMARVILDNASDVKLMPIKVLNDKGKGTTLSAYKGIKYAIEKKVDVINLSMSGIGQSKLLESAINEAYNNGIPVVVSAGNDNKDVVEYTPANIKSAFTISAANKEDDNFVKAPYSNYGDSIDYSANGHFEYVRNINDKEVTTKVDGTSVSSAYVTGYIAMLKQMAKTDEDADNDNLSITDIDTSFENSAIKLDNTNHFGRGYLTKENIKLVTKSQADEILNVEEISDADLEENIELQKNGAVIGQRELFIRDLAGDWYVEVYLDDDNSGNQINTFRVTPWDGYHGIASPDGGVIHITKIDDKTVQLVYENLDVTNWTPYIRVGVTNSDNYQVDNPVRLYPLGSQGGSGYNSYQNLTEEVHYIDDIYFGSYVDCYGGIGVWDNYGLHDDSRWHQVYDIGFVGHYIDTNIHVAFHAHGGKVVDHGAVRDEVVQGYDYTSNGLNWAGEALGRNIVAQRDGYVFKGWYISERNDSSWEMSPKSWVTDLIDYANRNADLYNQFAAYDYNAQDLSTHFWLSGVNEPSRKQIDGNLAAASPASWLDEINAKTNYDDYRQLLKDGKGVTGLGSVYFGLGLFGPGLYNNPLAGKHLVAHAVWEDPRTGFNVVYDANGGKINNSNTLDVHYGVDGLNGFGLGVGANAPTAPEGKRFIGWYFSENDGYRTKTTLTNLLDYANRNLDVRNVHGYNIDKLNEHFWTYGVKEKNRLLPEHKADGSTEGPNALIAEHCSNLLDAFNGYDFDNYRQLLPADQFVGGYNSNTFPEIDGKTYFATAIYEDMKEGEYKITYNLNGGIDPGNPTTYTKDTPTFTLINPTKPDVRDGNYTITYTFTGWSGTGLKGNNNMTVTIPQGSEGDREYTAHWKETRKKDTDPVPPTPGEHQYSIMWHHMDGKDDSEKSTSSGTYTHTWDEWIDTSHYEGEGEDRHLVQSGYWKTHRGDTGRHPYPNDPYTGTLHFDEADSTSTYKSSTVADIKTKKKFLGWYAGGYQPGQTFKDLFPEGSRNNLYGRWQKLPTKLPTPTRPEYDFIGWELPDGTVLPPGSSYTLPDDNDVTFTAVWRRNQGQVNYKANGATTNNGDIDFIGPEYRDVLDSDKTRLDSNYQTKSGAMFGDEWFNTGYVERKETVSDISNTQNSVYYITNRGDIVNTKGSRTDLYSFQGWSAINYARVNGSSPIMYNGITRFMNIFYDAEAVGTLGLKNKPANLTLAQISQRIINLRNININAWNRFKKGNWYQPIEDTGIVDMYAIWDKYPVIKTNTFNITSNDLEKITEEDLRKKILVEDEEDGVLKGKSIQLVYDINQWRQLVEQGSCYTSITVIATDSVGNTTKKVIMIGLNQSNAVGRDEQGYIRLISRSAYNKASADGGVIAKSVWVVDEDYKRTINENFDNLENDTPEQKWVFTHDQVLEAQEYIKNNGLGKTNRPNALNEFYDRYRGCMTVNKKGI